MRLRQPRLCAALILAALLTPALASGTPQPVPSTATYIIQSDTAAAAAELTSAAGGRVTRELAIINGVAAELDAQALASLQANPRLRLHADTVVRKAADPVVPEAGPADTDAIDNPTPEELAQLQGSSAETFSAKHLLYPAAATGTYRLREPYRDAQELPHMRCKNQRVEPDGDKLKKQELLGWGVTVAVIDSGFEGIEAKHWKDYDPATRTLYTENAEGRCVIYRDFLPISSANDNLPEHKARSVDQNGHGTHVISTIANARSKSMAEKSPKTEIGVAPKVNLLIARALDKDGAGSYADVIAAIEWVVQNKDRYRVRVLNLSLYAPVGGPYWADPMNQAVMKAWQAGIVVVVAAGNSGPEAGTITAPGNVPYVITVGAIKSGRYTQSGEDELAAYSSRGPTESAFVKPDVVVPASRTIAPMAKDSKLASELNLLCSKTPQPGEPCVPVKGEAEYGFGPADGEQVNYYLSGTSMAAAEVSGIVALILQAQPQLTNDQVKWRLLSTARPNVDRITGKLAYSPWEQGAGLVDVVAAVKSTDLGSANAGLDIALDLDVTSEVQTHYWGYTTWDSAAKEFRLIDPANGLPIAVWSGGTRAWVGGTRAWVGGTRAWVGGTRAWVGGTRAWVGGTRAWVGGTRAWVGNGELWSGGTRAWVGATIPSVSTGMTRVQLVGTD